MMRSSCSYLLSALLLTGVQYAQTCRVLKFIVPGLFHKVSLEGIKGPTAVESTSQDRLEHQQQQQHCGKRLLQDNSPCITLFIIFKYDASHALSLQIDQVLIFKFTAYRSSSDCRSTLAAHHAEDESTLTANSLSPAFSRCCLRYLNSRKRTRSWQRALYRC